MKDPLITYGRDKIPENYTGRYQTATSRIYYYLEGKLVKSKEYYNYLKVQEVIEQSEKETGINLRF